MEKHKLGCCKSLVFRNVVIIEAMLRLRQIACHPHLVKLDCPSNESAKLDILMEKLEELRRSSDKVLIFSQPKVCHTNILTERPAIGRSAWPAFNRILI